MKTKAFYVSVKYDIHAVKPVFEGWVVATSETLAIRKGLKMYKDSLMERWGISAIWGWQTGRIPMKAMEVAKVGDTKMILTEVSL